MIDAKANGNMMVSHQTAKLRQMVVDLIDKEEVRRCGAKHCIDTFDVLRDDGDTDEHRVN